MQSPMKRIMVVDDDTDYLAAMKGFLKQSGYEVAVTTSCDEGLLILISFAPHLIFLDIDVGAQDGREMCRKIKSMADHKHIPIILVSGNYSALETYKTYQADEFLKKPFEPSELLNLASSHLTAH
jgi:DNA-binding response OmpR family regulator